MWRQIMSTAQEKLLQRSVTWLNLISTTVGLTALIIGGLWTINLQLQRHDWWIQQHQKAEDISQAQRDRIIQSLNDNYGRLIRIEEAQNQMNGRLDRMRDDIYRLTNRK